jgi:5-hydroxyisourate hydrolase/2-oxo-4-hydroxy-4-carboxy-5-ureidoimidazoline decarboxylase
VWLLKAVSNFLLPPVSSSLIKHYKKRLTTQHIYSLSFFASLYTFVDTPLRSPITTHVLDTCIGKPAPHVAVCLERKAPGSSQAWETVATGKTNVDGRVPDLLPPSEYISPGIYRISFDTDEYMSRCKAQHPTFFADVPFYPAASVQFQITPEQVRQHFHVPLTWNPYGYSTYRGS